MTKGSRQGSDSKAANRKRWQDVQPFRPTSINGLAWVEALKGTTQKALQGLAKKHDAKAPSILRVLRKQVHPRQGFTWKVEEGKGGSFKIYNVRKK